MKKILVALLMCFLLLPGLQASAEDFQIYVDFDELREDANLYYKLSSATFAAFTSQTSFTQGTFTAKTDDMPDAHFDVMKFPIPYYFNKESNIQPFVKLTYGYSRLSHRYDPGSPYEEDKDKTEKLTVQTHSIGLSTGVRWEYVKGFFIEPSVGVAYSHIRRKIESDMRITEWILAEYPSLKRDIFDTTVEVYSIAPTIKHKIEYPLWVGNVGLDLHYIFQYSSSFRSKSSYADFSSNSRILYLLLNYEIPTGRTVCGKDLSVEPFMATTYFFGDVKDGMDMNHLDEYGINFILDVGNVRNLFTRLSIGGSYITGHDFYGWKFGLTFI